MAGRLKDKKSLITAAGKGIGRSTVLAFVHEGARVLATDIDQDSLDHSRKNVRRLKLVCLMLPILKKFKQ